MPDAIRHEPRAESNTITSGPGKGKSQQSAKKADKRAKKPSRKRKRVAKEPSSSSNSSAEMESAGDNVFDHSDGETAARKVQEMVKERLIKSKKGPKSLMQAYFHPPTAVVDGRGKRWAFKCKYCST